MAPASPAGGPTPEPLSVRGFPLYSAMGMLCVGCVDELEIAQPWGREWGRTQVSGEPGGVM